MVAIWRAVAVAGLGFAGLAGAESLTGQVVAVLDGDTIVVRDDARGGRVTVRLAQIDERAHGAQIFAGELGAVALFDPLAGVVDGRRGHAARSVDSTHTTRQRRVWARSSRSMVNPKGVILPLSLARITAAGE